MKLVLTRPNPKVPEPNSIIGELSIDGKGFCFTLELPWKDNQHNISCIPVGVYQVSMAYSTKFKKIMPHVMNVPGRDGILIHVANYPKDIEGCIGVGITKAPDFVGSSVAAFNALIKEFQFAIDRNEGISIEIKEEGKS